MTGSTQGSFGGAGAGECLLGGAGGFVFMLLFMLLLREEDEDVMAEDTQFL
tara:strand:+ start:422 stop:574 length:153 start_codon:yes stop_codon:yes gene_type:complete